MSRALSFVKAGLEMAEKIHRQIYEQVGLNQNDETDLLEVCR